jgi:hypothetical protein
LGAEKTRSQKNARKCGTPFGQSPASSARFGSGNLCPQFAQSTPFDTSKFDSWKKKLALPAQPQERQNEKCIQRSCGPAKPVECTRPNGKRHDNTGGSVRKGETPNHCVAQRAGWNVARQP